MSAWQKTQIARKREVGKDFMWWGHSDPFKIKSAFKKQAQYTPKTPSCCISFLKSSSLMSFGPFSTMPWRKPSGFGVFSHWGLVKFSSPHPVEFSVVHLGFLEHVISSDKWLLSSSMVYGLWVWGHWVSLSPKQVLYVCKSLKQFSIKNLGRPDTVLSESEEELVWALVQPSWLEFSIAHNLLIQHASWSHYHRLDLISKDHIYYDGCFGEFHLQKLKSSYISVNFFKYEFYQPHWNYDVHWKASVLFNTLSYQNHWM